MPPFKLPKLNIKGTNIKEGMDKKYGHGEYSRGSKKFEERMKPGESKFNYDVRMRKEASKRATGTDITSSREEVGLNVPETKFNPNDLRKRDPHSFVFSGKPGDKMIYRNIQMPGEEYEGVVQEHDTFEFQRDPGDKEYKGPDVWETPKTTAGIEAIENLYWADDGPYTKDPYYAKYKGSKK